MNIAIKGLKPAIGTIEVLPSKNASLPLAVATLLTDHVSSIRGYPIFGDPLVMLNILKSIGVKIHYQDNQPVQDINIQPQKLIPDLTKISKVSNIRGSVLLVHALLVRLGQISIPMPGGCNIGQRPIDIHCKNLIKMGASIDITDNIMHARVKKLHGARLILKLPSVGATQGAIIAGVTAEGNTTIINAAQDPEIVELANAINNMGGKISGHGSHVIKIEGVDRLNGMNHAVIQDRIEASTLVLIGALIPNSKMLIQNAPVENMKPLLDLMQDLDLIEINQNNIQVKRGNNPVEANINITVGHYPDFPTDIHPQLVAFATSIKGDHSIKETLFENRMQYAEQLKNLGFKFNKSSARGVETIKFKGQELEGGNVKAQDLRGGCALVIAGLRAKGITHISSVNHIDRGYFSLSERLRSCNIDINMV